MEKRVYVKMNPEEKARIVNKMEAKFGNAIFDPLRVACLEGCHCNTCVQKAFDVLINKSELAIHEALA